MKLTVIIKIVLATVFINSFSEMLLGQSLTQKFKIQAAEEFYTKTYPNTESNTTTVDLKKSAEAVVSPNATGSKINNVNVPDNSMVQGSTSSEQTGQAKQTKNPVNIISDLVLPPSSIEPLDFDNATSVKLETAEVPSELTSQDTNKIMAQIVSFHIGQKTYKTEAIKGPGESKWLYYIKVDDNNYKGNDGAYLEFLIHNAMVPLYLTSATTSGETLKTLVALETVRKKMEKDQMEAMRAQHIKQLIAAGVDTSTLKSQQINDEDDRIFTKIENEARFPGNNNSWATYLLTNLNQNIANKNGAPVGTGGTVVVQFIVDVDGTITDVEAISGPTNYGMRAEAVRLIKKSPRWVPGFQNGRTVKSYKKQPITFTPSK